MSFPPLGKPSSQEFAKRKQGFPFTAGIRYVIIYAGINIDSYSSEPFS
jgi:hypothetical protein